MNHLKMRKILALASMGCLIVFFQNCSDMQTSQLLDGKEDKSVNAGGAGLGAGVNPPDAGETIVLDNPDVQTTNATASTATSATTSATTTGPVPGTDTVPKAREDEDHSVEAETHPSQDEIKVDFAAACKDLRLFKIKNILVDVKNVEGLHGPALIKSDRVELIQDHSSVLVVVGNTSVAMVSDIIDVHGYTIICNAVVDRIESVTGTLVLVDTIVNDLVDQRGRLVSIRSKIRNRVNE